MDLRRIEGEIEELSTIWEALRHKRPRFEEGGVIGTNDESLSFSLSSCMPSWKELLSKAQLASCAGDDDDDDATNATVADEVKIEQTIDRLDVATATTTAAANNTAAASKEDEHENNGSIDYEFGMCLVGGGSTTAEKLTHSNNDRTGEGGVTVWDRYASKILQGTSNTSSNQEANIVREKANEASCDNGENEKKSRLMMEEDARPEETLSSLEMIRVRSLALTPNVEKLRKKSKERDLVTKKPRFGEKTMERVKSVLRSFAALQLGVSMALDDTISGPGLISTLRSEIRMHSEKREQEMNARRTRKQEEADRLAQHSIRLEELERQRIILVEQARREEEEMLARRAHEARIRRMEEERAAEDAVRAADRELLALVPNIGPDGVRSQIGRMKMAIMKDNNNDEGNALIMIALSSLRDMFTQIVRHPEEMKYRTVRRDHPKFIEDIGCHVGGREILIAAGFRLENVEGVPCLYSKEPDVENDMDGWSDWFDNLKKTLDVIEEQIMMMRK